MWAWCWVACTGPAPPEPPADAPPTPTAEDTATPASLSLTLEVAAVDGRSDAVDLVVGASALAPVGVECEGGGEIHRWSGDAPAETRLSGLLADTDLTCTARAGDAAATATTRTGPLPDDLPTWTVTGSTTGYTLFNHWLDGQAGTTQRIFLVDSEGRVRWTGRGPTGVLSDLDLSWVGDGVMLVAGASGHAPTLRTLDNDQLWTAPPSGKTGWYHHDADPEPSGDVLCLATTPNTNAVDSWWGFAVIRRDPVTDTVRWAWDSQLAFDAGLLPPPATPDQDDPWHANAISSVGGTLWVSLAYLDRILQIDEATGEVTATLGRDGDYTLTDGTWFDGQHDPEILGDRVLLHDNGFAARGSRVVEYELDPTTLEARVVWEWTEPGWYEPLYGDADRVGEDRVIVTMGHCRSCAGVDPDRRSALVEVERATGSVAWRLELDAPEDSTYRAERIEPCAIFPTNTRYCPAGG